MLPQKCGTSTLQIRLRSIHDLKEFGKEPRYNHELNKLLTKHVELKDALRIEAYRERRSHIKACFIRNPYDRIYSWFLWTIRHNKKELKELSSSNQENDRNTFNNPQEHAKRLEQALHMQKRLEEAGYDFNRFVVNRPKRFNLTSDFTHYKGKSYMDFLGRIESFEDDFDRLCKFIDYAPEHRSSINRTLHPDEAMDRSVVYPRYIDHYSSRTIRIINKVHSLDFKLFRYKKVSVIKHFFST